MKIRITGTGLPKAQLAGQQPVRNSVSINGTTYFEGDPGYEQAKQEAAQMKQLTYGVQEDEHSDEQKHFERSTNVLQQQNEQVGKECRHHD